MKTKPAKPFNIWVQPLADKRKHCHHCEATITFQNQHISVGEYIAGKYRTGFYACGECLQTQLDNQVRRSGSYNIVARNGYLLPWYKGQAE
jgi:hypothetical protein